MILPNQNIPKHRKPLLICKNYPRTTIFPKGFLHNRVKKVIFDLKSWGPPKIFKPEAVIIQGLGLGFPFYVKKLFTRHIVTDLTDGYYVGIPVVTT
jgi:hypothetical protein